MTSITKVPQQTQTVLLCMLQMFNETGMCIHLSNIKLNQN